MAWRTLVFLLALTGSPALTADAPEETAELAEVLDGETLRLADGREVRLDGIRVPQGTFDVRARAAIASVAKGPLVLSFDQRRRNRYGQLLAQVHVQRPDTAALWLQQYLLAQGLAQVGGLPENRQATRILLGSERAARAARRGLWAYRRFAVLTPEEAFQRVGSFRLVEGLVVSATTIKGRTYINFGTDWRQDFTISLDRAATRRFKSAGLDPTSLGGRRVRVRGWLKSFNGPMIELAYPEWLEVLEP